MKIVRGSYICQKPHDICSFQKSLTADRYFYHSWTIFLSTLNEICPTENISQLTLDFYSSFVENLFVSNRRSLPNLTKLHLFIREQLHTGYSKYLRQIIDFTQLIEIRITCCSFVKDDELYLYDLFKLLQKSNKLKSFSIDICRGQYPIYPFLDQIIKLLPPQIKHLDIANKEVKQIQSLFQRFQHLSILEFPLEGIERPMEIEQWFHTNTYGSNFRKHVLWHNIWIGNKYQTELNVNPKRMKLNHRQTHNWISFFLSKDYLPHKKYSYSSLFVRKHTTICRKRERRKFPFQSIDTLPMKILHWVFDLFDTETLFFSVRPSLSRYLRSMVHKYDRLNFHLKIVSKCDFDVLCRFISPRNIRFIFMKFKNFNSNIRDRMFSFYV